MSLSEEDRVALRERILQAWEHLSNPDVYCIEMDTERVQVTRTWVPPLAAAGTRKAINPILKLKKREGR